MLDVFLISIIIVELITIVFLHNKKRLVEVKLHDLKNTLTILQSLIVLRHKDDLVIDVLQRACLQVKDILVPKKTQSAHICIRDMVLSAIDEWQAIATENIELEVEVPEKQMLICGDKSELKRLLDNLLQNACRAMPDGGKIKLQLKETELTQKQLSHCMVKGKKGKCVALSIQDDGRGITPKLFKKIFRPFVSAFTQGIGLGLTSVCKIVKKHHASLTLTSVEGQGSCFSIYFPMMDYFENKAKILVVDDDALQRALLEELLKQDEIKCLVAETPYEALNLMKENPDIDLLITDMLMPNMKGDVLYQELLSINPDLKAIMMSGKKCVNLPENVTFLEKPYKISELKDLISQLLAKQYDS